MICPTWWEFIVQTHSSLSTISYITEFQLQLLIWSTLPNFFNNDKSIV